MAIQKYEFQSFDIEDSKIDDKNIATELKAIEADILPEQKDIFEEFSTVNLVSESESSALEKIKNDNIELINQQILSILQDINSSIEKLVEYNDENINNIIRNFSKLTFDIAKKIAFKALNNDPISVIEQFFEDSFKFLKNETELKILVNPDVLTSLKLKIEELYPELLVKNKITFETDQNIAKYNCEISWYNGSLILNKEEITKKIEEFF